MKISYIILLFLAGCSPKVIYTPKEVDIPIAVPCHINMPAAPVWLAPAARNASLTRQVEAITSDLDDAHGYIEELEAAINSCDSVVIQASKP